MEVEYVEYVHPEKIDWLAGETVEICSKETTEVEIIEEVDEVVVNEVVLSIDSSFLPTFDSILEQFMKGYGTVENYLRTYGGEAKPTEQAQVS